MNTECRRSVNAAFSLYSMREGRWRRSRSSKEGKIRFLAHCCQELLRKLLF
jgi:hypothetical protein